MNYENVVQDKNIDFGDMNDSLFLLGLLSVFDNRYQAKADCFYEEISWKQFFTIICIGLCKEPPSIKELSEIVGSSHQNVKQILLKLEKRGFVQIIADDTDRRKQRVVLTEKTKDFCEEHKEKSDKIVEMIFHGISAEQQMITIQTILQMEENMKHVEV